MLLYSGLVHYTDMPQVSRNKLSKKTEDELIRNLNLVFSKIQSASEMQIFQQALFTDTEKLMLAKRLAMIVLIEDKQSDSEISHILHLTRITVAKMRYFYEARGDGFKIALKKLEEQKQLDSFKKFLISLARYTARAAGGRVKPTVFD